MPRILYAYLLFFLLSACSANPPDWLLNSHHAVAPDGLAYLYQHSLETGDSVQISVGTYVLQPAAGGAGIFDIMAPIDTELDFRWLSDSVALIRYPANARVMRQTPTSQFFQRITSFRYEVEE